MFQTFLPFCLIITDSYVNFKIFIQNITFQCIFTPEKVFKKIEGVSPPDYVSNRKL